jgi:hypothetical protein
MIHLPEIPSRLAFARVVGLSCGVLGISVGLLVICMALLADTSLPTLLLFTFPCWHVTAEVLVSLTHIYLQRRERMGGSTETLYYASLVPELGMQLCRLLNHVHVWYVHGLSFSVIDVLLLANTKVAVESLHRRYVTHRNFVKADANLKQRFRTASAEELAAIDDCCAICREGMDDAKVLPCGHYFHYTCLRSWLEQSDSCPVCRASLVDVPPSSPEVEGAAQRVRPLAPRRRRRTTRTGASSATAGDAMRGAGAGAAAGAGAGAGASSSSAAAGGAVGGSGVGSGRGGGANPQLATVPPPPLLPAVHGIARPTTTSEGGRDPNPDPESVLARATGDAVEQALLAVDDAVHRLRVEAAPAGERAAHHAVSLATTSIAQGLLDRSARRQTASRDTTALPRSSGRGGDDGRSPPLGAVGGATNAGDHDAAESAPNDLVASSSSLARAPSPSSLVRSASSGADAVAMNVALGQLAREREARLSVSPAPHPGDGDAYPGGAAATGAIDNGSFGDGVVAVSSAGNAAGAVRELPAELLEDLDEEREAREGDVEEEDDEDELTDDSDVTDDGYDEDEEVQSYLLFSSDNWRWLSWLPRLHLEIVQRRAPEPDAAAAATTMTTAEELSHLREVFPQVTSSELRRVLLASPSLEAAIEQLLDGLEP